jgi:hypothetical protein
VDLFRVQLRRRTLVEVEVPERGIQRPVQDGTRRLILQDVLGPVQVVDGRELALAEGAKEGLERMCRHEGIVGQLLAISYELTANG